MGTGVNAAKEAVDSLCLRHVHARQSETSLANWFSNSVINTPACLA